MIEQLKKALTTGVGLALKTWTEVEAAGKEMIKKAQLSEKDAGQFLASLKKSYEATQKKMESQVGRLVKDVLKKADVATSDDLKALKREIQSLKKDLKTAKTAKTAKTRKTSPAKVKPAVKRKPEAKTTS
jgi:polyhydroxyalkanoate synthesis regulator phasin